MIQDTTVNIKVSLTEAGKEHFSSGNGYIRFGTSAEEKQLGYHFGTTLTDLLTSGTDLINGKTGYAKITVIHTSGTDKKTTETSLAWGTFTSTGDLIIKDFITITKTDASDTTTLSHGFDITGSS